jgi:hypothetical protein
VHRVPDVVGVAFAHFGYDGCPRAAKADDVRTMRARLAVMTVVGVALTSVAIPEAVTAAPPTGLYISEFMASNTSNLANNQGVFDDWIELTNNSSAAVDLSGWHLTDDVTKPAKWTFPAGASIAANSQLVVFAANTPTLPSVVSGEYRANTFALGASGEYLGLTRPDNSVASEFAPTFPAQAANVSYGIDSNGDTRFFSTPTPRAANGVGDSVTAPAASKTRGFYTSPINVSLTSAGATSIRYTLDGSTPTATSGTVYTTAIPISSTTVLRVVGVGADGFTTAVQSFTYVFIASVLNQGTGIPGFPNGEMVSIGTGSVPEDTAMDPNVVTDPTYASRITGAMTSIPSMSVSAPVGTIFGTNGFYDTEDNEVPVSVELLYPNNPTANEMMNGGAESHSHDRLKRSMRLNFSATYGSNTWNTSLFRNAPVNGASATTQVRTLVLRGGNNRAWTRSWNPDLTDFTLDQLYRDTQVAMSGYGSRGTFVHLYINGVYWGVYNAAERPDDDWAASYFGGDDDNWFWINHGGPSSSKDPVRWNYLMDTLVKKDMAVSANYAEMQTYLDIDSFIDYVAEGWWFGMTDWPTNNWYAVNRNTVSPDTATPAKFVAWDGEWSMDSKLGGVQPLGAWVHPDFLPGATSAAPSAILWHALRQNPTFMARFVQRVTQQTGPGGALTDAAVQARATVLDDFVHESIIGESARWGDALESIDGKTRTVDVDWQRAVDSISSVINGNTGRFISALKAVGYYPNLTAPTFSPAPGRVSGPITLSAAVGTTIRYTTDGSDPSTSGTAQTYSDPITITQNTRVRTVATLGTDTSPIVEGTYLVPSLMVTEIHYHPADPSTAETNAGHNDADLFEFIEIRNTSTGPLPLTGLSFDAGITATASAGTVAAGESVVMVVNEAAFRARYGNAPRIVGIYTGNLSNGGEQIRMRYPAGVTAFDVTYDDIAPWPVTPDGSGPSLELIDPAADVTAPANWRASETIGGTPGNKPPADRTPPTVVSVVPVNGGTNVSITTAVVITFSESVDASSTLGITLAPAAGGSIIATSSTTVGSKVTLQPNVALGNEVTYRVTVPTTVTDLEGNALATAFTATFTTAAPLVSQPATEDPTVPPPLAYTAVSPSRRLFDSREVEFGAAPLAANTPRVIATGLDGSVTKAVLVNITYVTPQTDGFVTAWAAGTQQPRTSNVNALAGEVVANTAVVPVDAQGRIQLLTNTTADVVVDLFGRFDTVTGAVRAGRFVPLAPGRLADTRDPVTAENQYTEIAGSPVSVVRVPVAGRRSVPSTGVASVVLTVTALAGADDRGGWVAVGAGGAERPSTSSVNTNRAGDIRPNLVVVPVGADGTVDLHLFQADDVVVDVAGWFTDATAAASTTGRFHSVTPTREVDTRIPQGFARFDEPGVRVLDPLAVPATAIGVAQNLTIVDNGAAGFVTSYPDEERPFASNANATGGAQLRAASAFTRLGSGGVARYYAMMSTDLVVDVTGWFEGPAA